LWITNFKFKNNQASLFKFKKYHQYLNSKIPIKSYPQKRNYSGFIFLNLKDKKSDPKIAF